MAGLFTFGFIEELTGNMRNSALTLGLFFVIGFVVLFAVLKKEKAFQV